MAVQPYTSQSISGYNSSPPPDDGSQTSANLVQWSKHKTKIGDPIKTLAEAMNTAMANAAATMALHAWTALTSSATMAESNWNKGQIKTATGGNLNYPAPSGFENGWYNFAFNGGTEDWHLVATASTFWRRRDGQFASEHILPPGRGIQVMNTATVYIAIGWSPSVDDADVAICAQMFS